ncbi:elongation factor P [Acrasis kona]|uniref:Elongation factor P n=1 Tax=Acrasis kona TaxID=1008807 RepID=A0AAW2Z2R9_9EUKA
MNTQIHSMHNDPEYKHILEELKLLSQTQLEQKISQSIAMGQTLQLVEEQEIIESEKLGVMNFIENMKIQN